MYYMPVCSVEEMRRIDELAYKNYGIDHLLLMEDAGSAVYSALLKEIGSMRGRRILVIAGIGNNGGDALVAARRLYASGGIVKVVLVGDPSRATDLCKRNLELVRAMGVDVYIADNEERLEELDKLVEWAEVIVVGLIGIGLKGEVRGLYRRAIEAINRSKADVVSVDIPSGIDGNNGLVRGVAVRSSITVALGLPKYGNILYPGYQYCGKLYVSHLSYPPELLRETNVELNTPTPLPERIRWGHKGMFGKFLVVGGARYYYGAPYYASYSFLKAGGGYSRLAAPRTVIPYIAARCSEVVYIPLEETAEGSIAFSNYEYILRIIETYEIDIVAIGSGASLNPETQELIRVLTESINRPLIIDGDGITAISPSPERIKARKAPTILTPHLGEFSRLTGLSAETIRENPIEVLRKSCRDLNSYIVLKGAHSLICNPDGHIYINMTGNPGMAKAGSGDVLTGVIAAIYGIGLRNPGDAVRMGVLLHGLAGDIAADRLGEDGVTPDDILNSLPEAVRILRENPGYIIERYMPKTI
jgi:NAD(P)H-hydrate epimerase